MTRRSRWPARFAGPTPTGTTNNVQWARDFHEALEPYVSDGVYVTLLDRDGSDRVRDAYGEWHGRLREVNAEWDPENLFRVNQNIEPVDRPVSCRRESSV